MKRKRLGFLLILTSSFLFLSGTLDLNDLFNYASQSVPEYITKDNLPANNLMHDAKATLGRVLF